MNSPRSVVAALAALSFVVPALIAAAQAPRASAPIEGVWIHAKDPEGKLVPDSLYEGATLTLERGGKYVLKLADFPKPLGGTWVLRSVSGDVFRIHTDHGEGRTNDMTVTLHRDASQAVVGIYVLEDGRGPETAVYYTARK